MSKRTFGELAKKTEKQYRRHRDIGEKPEECTILKAR